MNFTSGVFTLIFFPAVLIAFVVARRYKPVLAVPVLLLASVLFYAASNLPGLPLLLLSIGVNYWITGILWRKNSRRTLWSTVGVVFNLLPLVYYKYWHSGPAGGAANGLSVVAAIPLGLSFYTFQQITCLFDIQREGAIRLGLIRHALFAGFFAQIPSGPISRYRDLAPQVAMLGASEIPSTTMLAGMSLFILGLAKKLLLADRLGLFTEKINAVIASGQPLGFSEAWLSAWGFFLQLYFDFSGYSDMAIGIALCFGLTLAINFNSPLKAASGSEFVDRWHMSLVGWVREYFYQPLFQLVRKIPFGPPSRRRVTAWIVSTIVSMGVLGAWHGSQVTLLLSGCISGVLLVTMQLPGLLGPARPRLRAASAGSWMIRRVKQFFLLAVLSVLGLALRSNGLQQVLTVMKSMADWRSFTLPGWFKSLVPDAAHLAIPFGRALPHSGRTFAVMVLLGSVIVFYAPNTMQIFGLLPYSGAQRSERDTFKWRPTVGWGFAIGLLVVLEAILSGGPSGGFLYERF